MAQPAKSERQYPIVLRFKPMFPHDIAGYVLHEERKGRGSKHCEPGMAMANRFNLIGEPDWRERFEERYELARLSNFAEELEALEALGRKKDWTDRADAGPLDPWKASKQGPLREVIITVNKDWFNAFDDPSLLINAARSAREDAFVETSIAWLKERFGDAVITARADFDETVPHIHAIIAPWAEKTSKRRGRQHLLVPSAYELLKSYEQAQTDIADYFAPLELVRGQRRAEERRQAEEGGTDKPEYRENQCSHVWREAEAARLRKEAKDLRKRERDLAEREAAQRVREAEIATRERATAESEAALRKAQVKADAKAARLDEREAVIDQVETLLDVAASQGTVDEAQEDEAPLTARIRRKLGRVFASLSVTAKQTAENETAKRMAAAERLALKAETFLHAMRGAVPRLSLPIIEKRVRGEADDFEEANLEAKNVMKPAPSRKGGDEIEE